MPQMYGRSPVCVRLWPTKCEERENVCPHSEHWYGRSPVWTRLWAFRLELWMKDLPHTIHTYGLTPEWIRMWLRRFELLVKAEPHCSQWKFRSWFSVGIFLDFLATCLDDVRPTMTVTGSCTGVGTGVGVGDGVCEGAATICTVGTATWTCTGWFTSSPQVP